MTPQKKKIYIALIIVCFVLSAGILYSSFGGSDNIPAANLHQTNIINSTDPSDNSSDNTPSASIIDYSGSGYPVPAVFPATDKFKTDVLDSNKFKKLNPYAPVDITGQIGRTDPFKNY